MNQAIAFGQGQECFARDMQGKKFQFRILGVRRHFELALLVSLLIHAMVLSVMFIDGKLNNEHEFNELKIQLQEDGQDKQMLASLLARAQQEQAPRRALEKQVTDIAKHLKADKMLQATSDNAQQLNVFDRAELKEDQAQKAKLGNAAFAPKSASQKISSKPVPAAKPQTNNAAEKRPLGNSKSKEAQALIRYEQLLPLWLNRFRTYPPLARQLGLEGIGTVYLRINREGKVLLASVSRSTGHQILDDALLSMVAAANPVIPVPQDYNKENDVFSYQIEFRFKLDE